MNIQMGHLPEGDLVMVCDRKLPAEVRRVEYFREQKLLMLVYAGGDPQDELMHYEMPDDYAARVEQKSSMVIAEPDAAFPGLRAYHASLIQIGA
jgi:hypothetical protein